jgi:hypothetical protein
LVKVFYSVCNIGKIAHIKTTSKRLKQTVARPAFFSSGEEERAGDTNLATAARNVLAAIGADASVM